MMQKYFLPRIRATEYYNTLRETSLYKMIQGYAIEPNEFFGNQAFASLLYPTYTPYTAYCVLILTM